MGGDLGAVGKGDLLLQHCCCISLCFFGRRQDKSMAPELFGFFFLPFFPSPKSNNEIWEAAPAGGAKALTRAHLRAARGIVLGFLVGFLLLLFLP